MDGTTIAIVLMVASVTVVVIGLIVVWRAHAYLSVRITRGDNDDSAATSMFIYLVNEVEREMIIHDDGDSTDTSIYNDVQAIEAVTRRLQEHSDLTIRCFFNKQEDVKMVSLGEQFPDRFLVRYRHGKRPSHDIHYKIIDDGLKGYLSVHDPGRRDREYELIDCTESPKRVRQRMFRKFYHQILSEYDSTR